MPKLVETIPVTDAAAIISATNFALEMPVDVIDQVFWTMQNTQDRFFVTSPKEVKTVLVTVAAMTISAVSFALEMTVMETVDVID